MSRFIFPAAVLLATFSTPTAADKPRSPNQILQGKPAVLSHDSTRFYSGQGAYVGRSSTSGSTSGGAASNGRRSTNCGTLLASHAANKFPNRLFAHLSATDSAAVAPTKKPCQSAMAGRDTYCVAGSIRATTGNQIPEPTAVRRFSEESRFRTARRFLLRLTS